MRKTGRVAIGAAFVGLSLFGAAFVACGGGDDSASPQADASSDVQQHPDVVVPVDDSGGPTVCAPELPAGYTHVYAPPRDVPTACTPDQVQAYWDACLGTAETDTTCTAFFGAPANSPCIACLDSQSTESTYGTLIDLPNDTSIANVAGCISLIDGDFSDAGCGAKYQAYQFCKADACEANCPVDTTAASFTAYNNCQNDAGGTVCAAETAAANCGADPKYARCKFASYEAYIVGIGNIMCASASDGGISDGGDGG